MTPEEVMFPEQAEARAWVMGASREELEELFLPKIMTVRKSIAIMEMVGSLGDRPDCVEICNAIHADPDIAEGVSNPNGWERACLAYAHCKELKSVPGGDRDAYAARLLARTRELDRAGQP